MGWHAAAQTEQEDVMNSHKHGSPTRARLVAMMIAALVAPVTTLAVVSVEAGSAAAATLPSSPTDPSFCADYGEASNGSYAGVLACNGPFVGAVTFSGNGGAQIESDSVGFQCVELATRYLYAERDWGVLDQNGANVVAHYGATYGVTPVVNGSGVIPEAGDVISFSVSSNFANSPGDPGHVAIVTSSQLNSNGTGYVKILSENFGGESAVTTLAVKNSAVVPGFKTANSAGKLVSTPHIEWLPSSSAASTTLIHTAAALIPGDGASGYVLDGYGGIHPFGNAPAVTQIGANGTDPWPNWDIARAIAVTAPGQGYVLDGYGGLHPFGGAPALADSSYWPNWDIARGLAICPGGAGGYVLDGWGGIHAIGNAPALAGSAYWSGWDIARGIVVNSTCTGGYVLDGYGGIHPFGTAPAVNASAYWGGWDIARSITLVTDSSGYVLDGWGGVHPFAATGTPMPPALTNPKYDAAGTDPFDAFVYSESTNSGVAVTRSYPNGLFWAVTAR
jgi:hypothetical protein